jgi:Xaa-Pro dipeptidase
MGFKSRNPAILSRIDMKTIVSTFCFGLLSVMASCRSAPPAAVDNDGYQYPEQILTRAQMQEEIEEKQARVVDFLRRQRLGGIWLALEANVSWISAGIACPLVVSDIQNVASAFIRDDGKRYLILPAHTPDRVKDELRSAGFEMREVAWHEGPSGKELSDTLLRELCGGQAFGSDFPFPGAQEIGDELRALRMRLTNAEIRKYRWLGKSTAEAIESVCRCIEPGMTERGIEVLAANELRRRAIRPVALSVTADARVVSSDPQYPPGTLKVEKYASIRVHASRWGLIVVLIRSVHFGALPDGMRQDMVAAARVNAGFWARTVPGATAGGILQGAIEDYAEVKRPEAWKTQPQGGATGYSLYEWQARPGSAIPLHSNEAFAWSPAVGRVRIGETLLLLEDNIEILTATDYWPMLESTALGKIYRTSAILTR